MDDTPATRAFKRIQSAQAKLNRAIIVADALHLRIAAVTKRLERVGLEMAQVAADMDRQHRLLSQR